MKDKVMTTYEEMEPRGPVVSNGEGEGRPLADVIYIYTSKDEPGIMLYTRTVSDKYYDKFVVATYVEEAPKLNGEPRTGVIIRERIYPVGSRASRTFMVSLEEMKIILNVLKNARDANKAEVELDLASILKKDKYENMVDEKINNNYVDQKYADFSENIGKYKYWDDSLLNDPNTDLDRIRELYTDIYGDESQFGGDDSNNTFGI